jgi:hypothetical protein
MSKFATCTTFFCWSIKRTLTLWTSLTIFSWFVEATITLQLEERTLIRMSKQGPWNVTTTMKNSWT